jgi:hydrogenase maturation protease
MRHAPDSAGVLIVGYGNRVRSDDGAGPCAARRLFELGYNAIEAHQLTPELAEEISSAGFVIFVDADVTTAPGEIRVEAVAPEPGLAPITRHSCTPAELLTLARELYGGAPEAALIRIGAASFDFGESISEAAGHAVELAVAEAGRLADAWLRRGRAGLTPGAP